MGRKPSHKWAFRHSMRAGALGWRGSAKAVERLRSARTEIRAVHRADPVAAAEGVVALAERISARLRACRHVLGRPRRRGSPDAR